MFFIKLIRLFFTVDVLPLPGASAACKTGNLPPTAAMARPWVVNADGHEKWDDVDNGDHNPGSAPLHAAVAKRTIYDGILI